MSNEFLNQLEQLRLGKNNSTEAERSNAINVIFSRLYECYDIISPKPGKVLDAQRFNENLLVLSAYIDYLRPYIEHSYLAELENSTEK